MSHLARHGQQRHWESKTDLVGSNVSDNTQKRMEELHWSICLSREGVRSTSKLRYLQQQIMKKRSEETQTLCAGCSKAKPKISPRRSTPSRGGGQNLISWKWLLPLPTNTVWWGLMHAISSYRGNRRTNTHTNPQTGPITIHCAAASAQCNYDLSITDS